MSDEELDETVREHYEKHGLDATKRSAMVDQARKHGKGWSMERLILWVAVAAVLIFAIQAALRPSVVEAEPDFAAASGKIGPTVEPEPAPVREMEPRAEMLLLSRDSGTVNCGGVVRPFDQKMTLPLNPENLPTTCLVTIDGKRGVFHAMGDSKMRCDVDGDHVTCVETVTVPAPPGGTPILADPDFQPPEPTDTTGMTSSIGFGTASDGPIGDDDDNPLIKAAVTKYSGQLTYCYEKRLKDLPGLDGLIEVGWTINAGVVVDAPYILSNSTGDEELADCIASKIKRWKFPEDIEGDVSWPFVFRARQEQDQGETDEEIHRDTVKEVVQKNAGQLRWCYENNLRVNPPLSGKIEISWRLDDGQAMDLEIESDTLNDPELGKCLMKKIGTWQFPKDLTGRVSWPFVFQQD